MATIGNAPVFPTESVLPGNLQVTGNATISGTTNSVGNLTENSNNVVNVADTGTITNAMINDGTIEATKLSGGQPGSAPAFAARAWVDFNGTGTVAIRGSGNVSSITDAGTGRYIMNFTTAMEDANYAVSCSTSYISTVTHMVHFVPGGADPNQHLAGSHRGETRRTDNNTNVDLTYIHIMIYR